MKGASPKDTLSISLDIIDSEHIKDIMLVSCREKSAIERQARCAQGRRREQRQRASLVRATETRPAKGASRRAPSAALAVADRNHPRARGSLSRGAVSGRS